MDFEVHTNLADVRSRRTSTNTYLRHPAERNKRRVYEFVPRHIKRGCWITDVKVHTCGI